MPAQLLAQRKKALADQLNVLINRKKEVGQSATKDELLAGAVVAHEENIERESRTLLRPPGALGRWRPAPQAGRPRSPGAPRPAGCSGPPHLLCSSPLLLPWAAAEMSVQQLMQKGRRDLADTDATLNRAERLVEDTLQTGTQVRACLPEGRDAPCVDWGGVGRGMGARQGTGRRRWAPAVPRSPLAKQQQQSSEGLYVPAPLTLARGSALPHHRHRCVCPARVFGPCRCERRRRRR